MIKLKVLKLLATIFYCGRIQTIQKIKIKKMIIYTNLRKKTFTFKYLKMIFFSIIL